jgi:integrase
MASIRKKGEFQFHVQVRRKNVKATKTFRTKLDAEKWARKTESEIDRGIYINTSEAERLTLSELIERYKCEELQRLKAQAQERSRLNIIEKSLGKEIIGTITASTILKYRNERLKTILENSVNREVTTIKRLLSFASNDCQITLPNGLPIIKKLSVDDSRERRVSDAEIDAICAETGSSELESIVKLALYTAMRRNEISNLKRINIDFKVPSLKLEDTKNGKNRIVPLMPAAALLLKSIPQRIDGFVFGLRGESISQAFERARDRARAKYVKECELSNAEIDDKFLVDLRLHDLRHEATSRLALMLPNVIELSRVTGHSDLKMLDRYYQVSVSDLAKKLA